MLTFYSISSNEPQNVLQPPISNIYLQAYELIFSILENEKVARFENIDFSQLPEQQ